MIRLDGTKMSKSKGNLIAPEVHFETVGADGLRLFHLFAGPPADNLDWTDQTDEVIEGCGRFLDRVWRLAEYDDVLFHDMLDASDLEVTRVVHRTIDKVTSDIERWNYNTAVAALMELVNTLSKWSRSGDGAHRSTLDDAIDVLLLLLAPMAPHVSAELWESRHPDLDSVHLRPWPVADPELVRVELETMVVQVNGKVRARLQVVPTIGEADATSLALGAPEVERVLAGRVPARVIARPPRLVNVIVE